MKKRTKKRKNGGRQGWGRPSVLVPEGARTSEAINALERTLRGMAQAHGASRFWVRVCGRGHQQLAAHGVEEPQALCNSTAEGDGTPCGAPIIRLRQHLTEREALQEIVGSMMSGDPRAPVDVGGDFKQKMTEVVDRLVASGFQRTSLRGYAKVCKACGLVAVGAAIEAELPCGSERCDACGSATSVLLSREGDDPMQAAILLDDAMRGA